MTTTSLLTAGSLALIMFSAEAQIRLNPKSDSFRMPGSYKQAANGIASPASEANATVTVAQGTESSFNPAANSLNYKNQANTARRPQTNERVAVSKPKHDAVPGDGNHYKRPAATVYVPKPEKIPYEPMVNTDHDLLR
jgi:hypothetical protein